MEIINVLKLPKYVDVQDRALTSKKNMANRSPKFEWKGKRQNFNKEASSTSSKKSKSEASNNLGSTQSGNSIPTCTVCGKKHRGVCYHTTEACY